LIFADVKATCLLFSFLKEDNSKMLSSSKWVLLLGLLFLPVTSSAQNVSNKAGKSIDLIEAITRTIEHNPKLRGYDFQLAAQQAREHQAGLSASPQLTVNIEDVAGNGVYDGVDNAQLTLGVAWLVEGQTRKSVVEVARASTASLTTKRDINRLDLAANTAQLYLEALAMQARLSVIEESLSTAKNTLKAVRKRVQAGRSAQAELSRAQAEVLHRELDREDIEHELSSSYYLLAAQWGEVKPSFSYLKGDVYALPSPLTYTDLRDRLVNNPTMIDLFAERNIRKARLQQALSESNPAWQFNLGVRHHENTGDQSLLAGVSIPFGERSRNQSGIKAAKHEMSVLDAKESELRIQFESSLYVQYQEYLHSLHRIEIHREKIIPLLSRALKETERAYRAGRYSYLELLNAQSELLSAKTKLLEASVDARINVIELERLTGIRVEQTGAQSMNKSPIAESSGVNNEY